MARLAYRNLNNFALWRQLQQICGWNLVLRSLDFTQRALGPILSGLLELLLDFLSINVLVAIKKHFELKLYLKIKLPVREVSQKKRPSAVFHLIQLFSFPFPHSTPLPHSG